MKKLVIAIAMVGLLTMANAVVVDLGRTAGDPADLGSETSRLNGQINLYNGVNDPDLPNVDLSLGWNGVKTEVGGDNKSYTLDLNGFVGYLLFKWGKDDRFYYVNDNKSPWESILTVDYLEDGKYTFLDDKNKGLSHYTVFNTTPIPEPTTAALGVGLLCLGLGLFKRRM